MFCSKCNKFKIDCSCSVNDNNFDILNIEPPRFNPFVIEPPKFNIPEPVLPKIEPPKLDIPIYEQREILHRPMFRPMGMDPVHWCLMSAPPGFIKF